MDWKNKLSPIGTNFHRIGFGLLAIYALGVGFYRGLSSNSANERFAWIILGLTGVLIVSFTFLVTDFGLLAWKKLMDWFIKQIRKYPNVRKWLIFPNILFSVFFSYYVVTYLPVDLFLRIFIAAYLILILPASVISLIRDDLLKENSRLSKAITREILIDNPQAAIENAFTHFEDHLRKKVSPKTNLFGNKLIYSAYCGQDSTLIYRVDGKDRSEYLFHLMSGAYSLFRNPRHHKIINDNEQKTQAILSLIDLMTEYVDASKKRRSKKMTSKNITQ
ncbi:MAG: TIGR02391 family protein [Anaerolineaceae bacterium]|jgi:hypothetical protein